MTFLCLLLGFIILIIIANVVTMENKDCKHRENYGSKMFYKCEIRGLVSKRDCRNCILRGKDDANEEDK